MTSKDQFHEIHKKIKGIFYLLSQIFQIYGYKNWQQIQNYKTVSHIILLGKKNSSCVNISTTNIFIFPQII